MIPLKPALHAMQGPSDTVLLCACLDPDTPDVVGLSCISWQQVNGFAGVLRKVHAQAAWRSP